MYITVLPPGRGRKEWVTWVFGVVGHFVGVVAGAATAAAIWYSLGSIFGGLPAMAVGLLAVAMGLIEVRVLPVRVFSSPWRIPQSWRRLWAAGYPTVFGFCMGLGLLTALSSPALYVVIAFGLDAFSLPAVLVVFGAFAIGRVVIPLTLAALVPFGTDEADALQRMEDRSSWAGPVEAVALLVYGAVTILG